MIGCRLDGYNSAWGHPLGETKIHTHQTHNHWTLDNWEWGLCSHSWPAFSPVVGFQIASIWCLKKSIALFISYYHQTWSKPQIHGCKEENVSRSHSGESRVVYQCACNSILCVFFNIISTNLHSIPFHWKFLVICRPDFVYNDSLFCNKFVAIVFGGWQRLGQRTTGRAPQRSPGSYKPASLWERIAILLYLKVLFVG